MLLDEFLNKYLLLNNPKLACPETNWLEIHTRMSGNIPAVCKHYPLLLSASTHWNVIKIEAANYIGIVLFFNSSKNCDLHCNNICVDINTCVKDNVLDHSEKKLS